MGAALAIDCHPVHPAWCTHEPCPAPRYDAARAVGLDAEEVAHRWPPFRGTCPACGERIERWASLDHMIAAGRV